jgi:hypothetical protein
LIVHKEPGQVRRLIERISDAEDQYYVSIFKNHQTGSLDQWNEELARFDAGNLTMVSKYSNGWGSFSLIQATLDAMQHFRRSGYDYFINLSGQCYPLKTVPEIKSTLAMGNGIGYLECNPLPWSRWVDEKGGFDRVYRSWYKPFKTLDKISIPRLSKNLPLEMRPYGGSQWFCLPKRHVDHVLELTKQHPEIVAFFKRALIPDELFFQTILMNSPYREEIKVDDNLRFIDWNKRCVPLPATMLSEDLERILGTGKLFARKFDPAMDGTVLDKLDGHLSLRGGSARPAVHLGEAGAMEQAMTWARSSKGE